MQRHSGVPRFGKCVALQVFAGWLFILSSLGFAGISAQAATVTITSVSSTSPLDALRAGDEVTLGIVLANDDQDQVLGIGIGAFGFDQNVLRPRAVEVSANIFSTSVFSTPIGPLAGGGLANVTHETDGSFRMDTWFDRETGHLQLVTAITLTETVATGALDIGVDGGLIADGDVHVRVTFEVLGGGSTSIQIGAAAEFGNVVVTRDPITGQIIFPQPETNRETLDIVALGDPFVPPPSELEPPDELDPPEDIDPPGDPDPPVISPPRPTGGGGVLTSTDAIPEPSGALLFAVGLASIASQRRHPRPTTDAPAKPAKPATPPTR